MDSVSTITRTTAPVDLRLCRGEVLAALSRVLDYSPDAAVPHHGRVAALAARMASLLRPMDRMEVFYAGLVHDIGLAGGICLATDGLNLTDQANRPHIRSHPLAGAQLLAEIPDLMTVAEMVLDHHEWVNGHGYPRGKVGPEIRPEAQVLRFADTCDFVLREQGSPELLAFLDAVRKRTLHQVAPEIANAGIEVLGEPGFYAQLLRADDVNLLTESNLARLAANDNASTEGEITALLELFAHVADAHQSDRTGHSRRVANLAVMVAMACDLSREDTTRLRWAAFLHDLGLVTVPAAILDKPTALTDDELAEVRRSVGRTAEFLATVNGLEEVLEAATSHGEAFDGTGYPRGLQGYEIPLGGRILAVCDTFDALTSRRPYREARDTSLAIDILVRGSGSLFDPEVVSVAVPVFLISASGAERMPG